MIEHGEAESPDKTAIIVADKDDPTRARLALTYSEVATSVRLAARRLRAASGAAKPVVSILTPLLAESFIAYWADATVGIANPINPFLRIEHVANIMNAAGTTLTELSYVFGRDMAARGSRQILFIARAPADDP